MDDIERQIGDSGVPGADASRGPLERLYDAHAAWMYRHALMVLADHAAAEDVLQQVFTKLASMGRRVEGIGSDRAYLRRALRNECYRQIGRGLRRRAVEGGGPLLEPVAPRASDEAERERLGAALRGLPTEQREVVHMKVYEGMTFERIAEATGVSPNTAASRYRYAIEKLRATLSQ